MYSGISVNAALFHPLSDSRDVILGSRSRQQAENNDRFDRAEMTGPPGTID